MALNQDMVVDPITVDCQSSLSLTAIAQALWKSPSNWFLSRRHFDTGHPQFCKEFGRLADECNEWLPTTDSPDKGKWTKEWVINRASFWLWFCTMVPIYLTGSLDWHFRLMATGPLASLLTVQLCYTPSHLHCSPLVQLGVHQSEPSIINSDPGLK